MIFRFVVQYLHFLAKIPLAPQFFDALLLTWTALFHRDRLHALGLLEQHATSLPNVNLCLHRYGGTGFTHNGREFAHVHSNGLLDVELTRELADDLIASQLAIPHHRFGRSRWISFWIASESDVAQALALLKLACKNATTILKTYDSSVTVLR